MYCVVHHFTSFTIIMSSGSKVHGDEAAGGMNSVTTNPPCGACKFLRRKCTNGCIFAPYFGSDQGAARFAAVHKVFGASNVSKLLQHIPVNKRQDTVVTVSYEAQARLSDPVYGCVSTILALQQQVAGLQAELAMVQTQLMNSKIAAANSLQASQQQQQHQHQQQLLMQPQQQMQMNNNSLCSVMLQPAYSNNSSSSNNMNQFGSFNVTQPSFEPLRLSQNLLRNEEEDEDEDDDEKTVINW